MQSKYCWTLVPPQVPQEDMSDHDEKDLIALKRLMQKIGQDWKQDDVSNHAAYVKGGLGFVQESRGALRRQVMAKVVHRVSTKNMSEVDVRTESTMKLKWSIAP
ncbi:hypothetical protein N7468_007924 [Penicillium chermesinum]|uniref:Uncharacterized protein n=1 Tax=Penicillium chermesinum TaxID=63820 RepID=A0A9W9THT3_9EURO|nr:uncharacterized protein N7468_007924 [Penicillium chermesinum]KAJ5223382.1 hypothetical protein N7468_007924 [Penicillium chermesinum]